MVLTLDAFAHYIGKFNAMEDENVTNYISNADSWDWMQKQIPFFECPDPEVEEMYYFPLLVIPETYCANASAGFAFYRVFDQGESFRRSIIPSVALRAFT